jgi:hypothetical protein
MRQYIFGSVVGSEGFKIVKLPKLRLSLVVCLIALTVIAVACAFVAPFVREAQERQAIREWKAEQRRLGGSIPMYKRNLLPGVWTYKIDDCSRFSKQSITHLKLQALPETGFLIEGFDGENCQAANDQNLADLSEFHALRYLWLANSGVGTEGLQFCAGLHKLEIIDLRRTSVDRRAMDVLANLPKLEVIHLSGTQITNDDLIPLRGNSSLLYIDLAHTAVTAGVADVLKAIPRLSWVTLDGSSVPVKEQEELEQFFKARYPPSADSK